MRLFDRVMSAGPDRYRSLLRSVSDVVVLQADDIARNYYLDKKQHWVSQDYPYACAPWTATFVEWREPTMADHGNGPEKIETGGAEIGVLVGRLGYQESQITLQVLARTRPEHNLAAREWFPQAYWMQTMSCVMSLQGRTFDPGLTITLILDKQGTVLCSLPAGEGLNRLAKVSEMEAVKWANTHMHIVSLAFTFANCSNVQLNDVTEQMQPSAKIRRRLKLPEVKRYTLLIDGKKSTKNAAASADPQTGIMPYHLCRGHFATYTAEKPLFGNPKLVGRYWHPPHTKGKKERGEVIKDYAIKDAASAALLEGTTGGDDRGHSEGVRPAPVH